MSLIVGGEIAGIDLVLPSKRRPARLIVTVEYQDGSPAEDAGLILYGASRNLRWSSVKATDENGRAEVPVYIGEDYELEASTFRDEVIYSGSVRFGVAEESLARFIWLY